MSDKNLQQGKGNAAFQCDRIANETDADAWPRCDGRDEKARDLSGCRDSTADTDGLAGCRDRTADTDDLTGCGGRTADTDDLAGCGGRAGEVLAFIRTRLEEAGIEGSQAESWIIMEWICGIDRSMYFLDPDAKIPEDKLIDLREILDKRAGRLPLQYLMGTCEFMGYPFYVNRHVLIPRQDTECLVEECVRILSCMLQGSDIPEDDPAMREHDKPCLDDRRVPEVLDLCTGSGCIGISIKKLVPSAKVTLSDISEEALAVAGRNAHDLGAEVDIICGDLFEFIHDSYHMIVSNPPYIPSKDIDDLMPEVRDYEPRLALDGEEDGLAFYRRIVHEAKSHLEEGGYLLFEIGMDQGEDLKEIFEAEGYTDIEIIKDLAGLDRITKARLLHR